MLSAARTVEAREYVYVFELVSRERCKGAPYRWTHVSGTACEKELNNPYHRVLVGLVLAHCSGKRGVVDLVYGVEVSRFNEGRLPVYLLTSIKAPKQLLEDLDKLRRRFLWAGDSEVSGGKCKVSWPLVTRPVQFGGLGILDFERFSRALRLRWLWLSWKGTQRPWQGMTLPTDDTDMALFAAATRVTIHDGRKAYFWHSSWIDGQTPASLFPLLFRHSRRKNRTVREAVLNGKWISDIAYNLDASLLREFFILWGHTQSLQLNTTQEDQIIWILESSGEYSARSAYTIQFSGQMLSNFPKLVWAPWAPPRCKFFLWLLLQNRVWTAARLQLRGWKNNYFCALCERSLETSAHLFIECPFSRKVWELVASWSNCANLHPTSWTQQNDIEDWFLQMTESGTRAAHSLAILSLWQIWKQRNAVVFNGNRRSEQAVFIMIKDECSLWVSAGGRDLGSFRIANHISE
jgi:hypothetical protein